MSLVELEGDLKSHREANDDDPIHSQLSDHGLGVIGQVMESQPPRVRRQRGSPVPAVVHECNVKRRGESRNDPAKGPSTASDAVEDQDANTGRAPLPKDIDRNRRIRRTDAEHHPVGRSIVFTGTVKW
jgi:hypothetical protein